MEDTQTTLKQPGLPASDDYIREHRLCFNFLRPGHPVKYCHSPTRCGIYKQRHHTLLHPDQKPSQLISSSVTCQTAPVHLMTTAATVFGSRGLATARVLFGHSSQLSFPVANLTERLGAKCLGYRRIELAGFVANRQVSNVHEYGLELMGVDGRPHKVTALERAILDLRIPPVAPPTIKCWQQYGIVLGDRCDKEEVENLLGAEWASTLQHEKIKNGDEFAYRTDFGWVLSGKSPEPQQDPPVFC